MSVVLAVEPDPTQAGFLRTMQTRLGAELVLVRSADAAVEAIDQCVPDLILLSTLLSPRDEDQLIAHLRTLDGASHLQTLTIPQFRAKGAREAGSPKKGFTFRKKRETAAPAGCDPKVFADEVAVQLARAAEARSRPTPASYPILIHVAMPAASAPEPMAVADQWATERFAAEPVNTELEIPDTPVAEPVVEEFAEPMLAVDPVVEELIEQLSGVGESVFDPPVITVSDSIDAELDRLARELGVSLDSGMMEIQRDNDDSAERMAAEVALVQAEAETRMAAELERVRAESEERRLTELARLQADADAMREAAIADARAAAEEETRRALAAEVARVRTETQGTVAEAVNRVRVEAEQTLSLEIGRAREDAEALRSDIARVQGQAAETARALENEVSRVRAEAEAHLKGELERIHHEAEQARVADQSHAKVTAEQIRETAAREARAIAEESARRMLDAEIARVRSQADTILETELARVRAEAQERQAAELLELRTQMSEMREVAASQAREVFEHARAAAELARAVAVRRPADVISFPVVDAAPAVEDADDAEDTEVAEVAEVEDVAESSADDTGERRDYYGLWLKATADYAAERETAAADHPPARFKYTRWIKWGLPAAASLALVVMSGIDTVARLASPRPAEPAPVSFVTEVHEREVVKPVESKLGALKVESTPSGAHITLDGESRGETPQTISNLKPGTHTLVLRSSSGTLTRHLTIRAGQTAVASEAIFAGWLAIFAPIALDISLNGTATTSTDDGRIMVAPGSYRVDMVNARFNFRRTETLLVKPGEVTAHTVSLPTGTLKISAPDGADVSVDGQPIGKAPFSELLPLVVGTHEIRATHPDLGERRTAVDVKFEETAEATLSLQP